MKPLTEQYNFEKFWEMFSRQNRSVSKWDQTRTDKQVFIERTLNRWFSGKCFQVLLKRDDRKAIEMARLYRSLGQKINHIEHEVIYTKYVLVLYIRFAYRYSDKIIIRYAEPHSIKTEEMAMGYNDLLNIRSIAENETDFSILRKFYPLQKNKPEPLINFDTFSINIKNHKKETKNI